MEVQSVGYADPYTTQQVQTKKKNGGKVVLGAAIAATGGAYGGKSLAEHMAGDSIMEAEKFTINAYAKEAYLKQMRSSIPDITDDIFETSWKNNKDSILKGNKEAYNKCLKDFKNLKTKWAVAGSIAAALIALVVGSIINRKNK